MSDRQTVAFLAAVPLLEGEEEARLWQLARVLRRRTVREGELLWRQGEAAQEMLFVIDGCLSASLDVPGDREVEIGRAGPGDVAGELGVLDGADHTMSMRATEATTVLALGRMDVAALVAGRHPSTLRLRRRLISLLAARLRNQLEHLGRSLGGEPAAPPPKDPAAGLADLEECGAPDSRYVRRMATFHDFDPVALWGFLTSGRYVHCPPGRTLLAEGSPSAAYYLTINGAVEKVLVRGDWRIRAGLAGPGRAFGYEGLIDGRPSPLSAVTRERALLLVLPREPFAQIFNGDDAVARGFLDVVQRDLMVTLRETFRPSARLAASA